MRERESFKEGKATLWTFWAELKVRVNLEFGIWNLESGSESKSEFDAIREYHGSLLALSFEL